MVVFNGRIISSQQKRRPISQEIPLAHHVLIFIEEKKLLLKFSFRILTHVKDRNEIMQLCIYF